MAGSRPRLFDPASLLWLAVYFLISFLFFGRGLVGNFTSVYVGVKQDPTVHIWCFAWWPYALGARINPFLTDLLWAPTGFNLTWMPLIPLPALAAWPLTRALGPVASFNVACIACPPLAAWSAFVLCRYLTRDHWAAAVGGFLFGFSSYVTSQMTAHLLFLAIFPVALGVYVFVRRFNGELSAAAYSVLLGLALAAEFLCAIELAATTTMCAVIVLGLLYWLGDAELRVRVTAQIRPTLVGYALFIAIVSPYLYYALALGVPAGMLNSPSVFAADFVNFVVPTRTNLLGALPPFHAIAARFRGSIPDADAYQGIPLILITAWFARTRWREPVWRALIIAMIVFDVLALGSRLHIAGIELIGMPWKIITHLPLIKNAIPSRVVMYASLIMAVAAAEWLATTSASRWIRCTLAALAVASLLPDPVASHWATPVGMPAFFADGSYRKMIAPGEIILALPFGHRGKSMLWQAETGMYFRMAEAWTPITPAEFDDYPIVRAFLTSTTLPEIKVQLGTFLAAKHVGAAVLETDSRDFPEWRSMFATLGLAPVETGGVTIYRITPESVAGLGAITPVELQSRAALERFGALVSAANQYVASGKPLADLTALRVERLGMLPPMWVTDRGLRTNNRLWLGPYGDGRIGVGLVGRLGAMRPVIARYRACSAHIYFDSRPLDATTPDSTGGVLQMVFDTKGLACAAKIASSR
jgi:hypothetical protein